ncbi:MAG: hypothetical protein IT385_24080 [Deltaproteobacteria bacterium]|nr:hypothetical protein [Deltaproteobacteria bacterium]
MRHIPKLAALAAIVTITACTEAERRPPEGRIEVQIGAKAIEDGGFANACFDIEIRTLGGGGEGGKPYVTRGEPDATYPDDDTTLCTNDIGGTVAGGRKAFSTALPCIDGETEVLLRLDSLWERNPAWEDGSDEPQYVRVTEFFDPCGASGCVQRVECKALEDVPAFFAIQVAKPLDVGFTDVMVSIGDLACAAKFDCEYPDDEGDPRPIQLLPYGGKLVDTGVMAVACSGIGVESSTYFNLTDMKVSCSDPEVEEPALQLAVAANKYQFVFGTQIATNGVKRGFYARVEGQQLGLAKELVSGNRLFVPAFLTEVTYGTTNNPAVLGYAADRSTGSNRTLAVATFDPGATGPSFVDLGFVGEPVAVSGRLALIQNGEDHHFFDLRTGLAALLKLNTDAGPLTNCGESAQLPNGFLVATCKLDGDLGVYAWPYEPGVPTITPIQLDTGGVTLSDNATIHTLSGGLYAIDKDDDKAVRWTAGSIIGVPLTVALKSPEIIGGYIVNEAIAGTYTLVDPSTATVYSAPATLEFTGIEFRYGNFLCLQSGELKACHFDTGTLVATNVTDTYTDGIATITDVQEIYINGLPGTAQYAFYLVLGFATDMKPIALYLRMDIVAQSPTYEVIGAELLEGVTGNRFLEGSELGGSLRHPWTLTEGGNVRIGEVLCKANGTDCRSELRAFNALPTSTSILALDNDPSILHYGSDDPYKCNWGVTEYGTLGAPETYMACMVGLPSCPNATFTVTLCPSEEPLICDEDAKSFGYPDDWWPSCITWEIALTDTEGERACTTHPLALGGTGVSLSAPRPSEALAFTRQLTEPRSGDGGTGTTEWFTACEPEPEP